MAPCRVRADGLPGQRGHRGLALPRGRVPDTGARKLVPKTVVVTPPNQKSSFELKWTYGGRVLDQSGAARPGTFVNPVKGS